MNKSSTQQINTNYKTPIVVVLGHVDHGKSTLLDYLRNANIVDEEVGNITQRISAYEISHKGEGGKPRKVTFLDTPGHEVFSYMRNHGALLADVAIIIVSAEDGVKMQTKEAIEVVKEANIPFIVAINKIDSQKADIEKTKMTLLQNNVLLEGFGGDIPFVNISSKTGENVSDLIDLVLLVNDIEEVEEENIKYSEGFVVESHIDQGKGITSLLLPKRGVIKYDNFIVANDCIASTKKMINDRGEKVDSVGIGTPVIVSGFDCAPEPGASFRTYETLKEARDQAKKNKREILKKCVTEDIQKDVDGEVNIKIVCRSGTQCLLKALLHHMKTFSHKRAHIQVVESGVGMIRYSDVNRVVKDDHRIIVGFQTEIEGLAEEECSKHKIPCKTFDVIYDLSKWIDKQVEKRIESVFGISTGKGEVIKIFSTEKDNCLVGVKILEGVIHNKQSIRILRNHFSIGNGQILSLKQNKETLSETDKQGANIGVLIKTKDPIEKGDIIEGYKKN